MADTTWEANPGRRIADNCWFSYLYRDADNFKRTWRIPLRGAFHPGYEAILAEHALKDRDYFCAEDVELPPIYPWTEDSRPEYAFDETRDHFWHELEGIYPANELLHEDAIATFEEAEHVLSLVLRFVRRNILFGWSANARQTAYMGSDNPYVDPESSVPTHSRHNPLPRRTK